MVEINAQDTVDAGAREGLANEGTALRTTLVTGAAIAILAPEWLPGMAIGVAAVLAPRLLPKLMPLVRPIVKSVVRAGYSTAVATRAMVAEASEQMQDMVAEARAEQENGRPAAKRQRNASSKRQRAHA